MRISDWSSYVCSSDLVFGALVLHTLVTYSLALKLIGGYSPVKFFKGVQEAMLMAFSPASSNATLPTALHVADTELGLPRRVSRFVLTIGATANQNGTALFEAVKIGRAWCRERGCQSE